MLYIIILISILAILIILFLVNKTPKYYTQDRNIEIIYNPKLWKLTFVKNTGLCLVNNEKNYVIYTKKYEEKHNKDEYMEMLISLYNEDSIENTVNLSEIELENTKAHFLYAEKQPEGYTYVIVFMVVIIFNGEDQYEFVFQAPKTDDFNKDDFLNLMKTAKIKNIKPEVSYIVDDEMYNMLNKMNPLYRNLSEIEQQSSRNGVSTYLGKWMTEKGVYFDFSNPYQYGWYKDKNNLEDNYYKGKLEVKHGNTAFEELQISDETFASKYKKYVVDKNNIFLMKLYFRELISGGTDKSKELDKDQFIPMLLLVSYHNNDKAIIHYLNEDDSFKLTRTSL